MRPSQRKAKRERDKMLKGVGIGAAALLATAGGVTATALTVGKKKSSKTEDTLTDVKTEE